MRDRNANHPNTSASAPGTSSAIAIAKPKCSEPFQYQGSCFQSRNTMKSGSVLR